jgi:hypothetical protein
MSYYLCPFYKYDILIYLIIVYHLKTNTKWFSEVHST